MKYLCFFAFLFTLCVEGNAQLQTGDVFVYESAPKIMGESAITFAIAGADSTKIVPSYIVYFSRNHLKKVVKGGYESNIPRYYSRNSAGGIEIPSLKAVAYNEANYRKHLMNPASLYTMIHHDFLNLSHRRKLEVLDSLSRR